MMKFSFRCRSFLRPGLALVCAATSAGPARAQSPGAGAPNEAIVLPEFNVAGTDEGWTATNTLTGTRTNMNLRDLPRSMQVVTSEFLGDILVIPPV